MSWTKRYYDAEREHEEADFDTALAALKFSLSVFGYKEVTTVRARGGDPLVIAERIKKLFVEHHQLVTSKYIVSEPLPTVRWVRRLERGREQWMLDFFVRFRGIEKKVLQLVVA